MVLPTVVKHPVRSGLLSVCSPEKFPSQVFSGPRYRISGHDDLMCIPREVSLIVDYDPDVLHNCSLQFCDLVPRETTRGHAIQHSGVHTAVPNTELI